MRSLWLLAIFLALFGGVPAGAQEPRPFCSSLTGQEVCIAEASYTDDVCGAIAHYAGHWQLPADFLARLIWQESRFQLGAVSPAGAQGIAQFMPGTARIRQLRNSFDPAEALARSAEYLSFLEDKYGNLGLAAAAYNAGEGRMSRVVAGAAGVPGETRQYVSIITGRSVEFWLGGPEDTVDFTLDPQKPFENACRDMASVVDMPRFGPEPGEWQPWGVLIAQSGSAEQAKSVYLRVQSDFAAVLAEEPLMLLAVRNPNFGPRLRYSAMVGRQTQTEAQGLCSALVEAGGNCIVRKN